jgi:hypothetical protein
MVQGGECYRARIAGMTYGWGEAPAAWAAVQDGSLRPDESANSTGDCLAVSGEPHRYAADITLHRKHAYIASKNNGGIMGNHRIAGFGLIAAAMLTMTACGGSSSTANTGYSTPIKTTSEVVYEVFGRQTSASVTIETPTGTSQKDISLPLMIKASTDTGLTYTFQQGSFVYISAQGRGGPFEVICRITVDGTVISRNSATGYGVASCKGTA